MKMITKHFGRIYVIKFLKFHRFLVFLYYCIENMCPFVEKKKKGLCLVQHISTKEPSTLLFKPRPTPPIINNYYIVQPLLLFRTQE